MGEPKKELPKLSDAFFISGKDYWNDSFVEFGHWGLGAWDFYIMGYQYAANILVDNVTNDNQDTMFYPIAFLYRHTIELQLKYLIYMGHSLAPDISKEYLNESINTTHNLIDLWDKCVKIILVVWPDVDNSELNDITRYLKQLNDADPKSDSFRYPLKKKTRSGHKGVHDMEYSIPVNVRQVSIKLISGRLKKISEFLDGCAGGIDEYVSAIADTYSDDNNNDYGDYND